MATDYELYITSGNVGQPPEERMAGDQKVITFSVAQPKKFGKDAPEPKWHNITVWDEGLKQLVRNRIKKGTPVVVYGKMTERNSGGKTYYNMNAYRIGIVDILFPLDKAPGRPAEPTVRQAPDSDDDIPF